MGEGAHGVVRTCVHKETGRTYAVKMQHMQEEQIRFLKTNFISIRQLKNDNIIGYKALYLDSAKHTCHLVMEYAPFPHLKPGM